MTRYPASRPRIGKREETYVLRALRSGVLSMGPFIERLENAFAKKIGAKHACAVSSGTAGLHLALIAAGIGKGDEVITSPFSFIASANAILYVGAIPVFADIDPKTYNIDSKEIEKKITKRTKAILPVHIFGQPADMRAIMRIARKHKLKVIEDACESLCAAQRGKRAGTFGQAGVFAFYPNKQMTTGEGGMIVTNDTKIDALCRSLRNQGRGENRQWLDHTRLGFNYRMPELSAALGLAQLENLDYLLKKRRRAAEMYNAALAPLSTHLALPCSAKGMTHTWFVYVVRILSKRISRDALMERLAEKGIETRPYLPSIHLFDVYRKLGHKEGEFPISEAVSATSLALPFYAELSRIDVQHIARTLGTIIKSYEKHI